jgi:hypothetical protein
MTGFECTDAGRICGPPCRLRKGGNGLCEGHEPGEMRQPTARVVGGLLAVGATGFEPATSRSRSDSETTPRSAETLGLSLPYIIRKPLASVCGSGLLLAKNRGNSAVRRVLRGRFRAAEGGGRRRGVAAGSRPGCRDKGHPPGSWMSAKASRPVVRPGKAAVSSGSQSRRGNNRKPRSWMAGRRETE